MEFQKPDERFIKCMMTSSFILIAVTVVLEGVILYFTLTSGLALIWKFLICGACVIWLALALADPLFLNRLEYRQWGYYITDDRVVIRHGVHWVSQVVVPVIRIQDITTKQGPIMKKYGLYKVEINLASGTYEIPGLTEETANDMVDKLKSRLYSRVAERGVL